MIKKCPHCAFEPIQDQLICPSCGSELNENISKQIKEDQTIATPVEESKDDPNDNINWSNYQDVSLGSVMEHFNDANDEETGGSTSEFADNPILEAYLRRHRDGDESADKDLAAAIAKQKENEKKQEQEKRPEEEPASTVVVKEKGKKVSKSAKKRKKKKEKAVVVEQEVTPVVEEAIVVSEAPVSEEASVTPPVEVTAESSVKPADVKAETTEKPTTEPVVEAIEEVAEKSVETPVVEEIKVEEAQPATEEKPTEEATTKETALEKIRSFEEKAPVTIDPLPPMAEEVVEKVVTAPENPVEKSPRKWQKKHMYLLGAAGILFVAGGGWLYVDSQQKAEAARQEQIQLDKDFSSLTKKLEDFYIDDEQQFVKPEKTTAELEKLMNQLGKFKQQENYSKVQSYTQDLHQKMVLIDTINAAFTGPIIVGDGLDKSVHIKGTEPLTTELLTDKTPFAILVNEALQLGKIEWQQVQSAKEAVDSVESFYKDGKLTAELSRKDFDAAKKQVDGLFDIGEKETLAAQLKPIEKALVAREKAAAQAQMQAQKQAEEAAARVYYEQQQQQPQQPQQPTGNQIQQENPGQELLNRDTPRNRDNRPIISSRQSDINDVNNAGWVWAPGVYDEFIKTVLARGYVVEGGFKLEPVRIENGEGYYHLFATSNKSKLLKDIPQSSMPYYIVTVNAKTGYFKGNGSN